MDSGLSAHPVVLIYWPILPGRGEYPRLLLEVAGQPYIDLARRPESEGGGMPAVLRALQDTGHEISPYAPPVLKHGDFVLAQTAAICAYLGERLGLVGESPEVRAHALQLQLTIMDLAAEVHDTHHPLGKALYYEDQRDAAVEAASLFREHRLGKFLSWFEGIVSRRGTGWLLSESLSYPDLSLAHTLDGLSYAFPVATARGLSECPELTRLRAAVAALPRVARYRGSDRCLSFNEDGIFRRYPELDG